jgi:hypothetical protein
MDEDDELYGSSSKKGQSAATRARATVNVRLPSPAIDEQNVSELGPGHGGRGGFWLVLTQRGGYLEVRFYLSLHLLKESIV